MSYDNRGIDLGSPFMEALRQADLAMSKEEVPVGAVVLKDNLVIGTGHNRVEELKDPSAHAEVLALKDASRTLGRKYLYGCKLFTTLEPCVLCASACMLFRVKEVVYLLEDKRWGGLGTAIDLSGVGNHRLVHFKHGEGAQASSKMLKSFFIGLREKRN